MANLSESRLFTSAEELDQANREAGWKIEYRQLMPGSFSSEFAARECSEFLVMRECIHGSLEVRGKSPEGMVTGVIAQKVDQRVTLNGQDTANGRFFVMLPGFELDSIVLGGVEVYSFWLPESVFFEAAGQANMSSLIQIEVNHRLCR